MTPAVVVVRMCTAFRAPRGCLDGHYVFETVKQIDLSRDEVLIVRDCLCFFCIAGSCAVLCSKVNVR